jgi:hypothetical protein
MCLARGPLKTCSIRRIVARIVSNGTGEVCRAIDTWATTRVAVTLFLTASRVSNDARSQRDAIALPALDVLNITQSDGIETRYPDGIRVELMKGSTSLQSFTTRTV